MFELRTNEEKRICRYWRDQKGVANGERDLIASAATTGWRKEKEDRIAVVERYGEETEETEEEGYGEFGIARVPTEMANDIVSLVNYGRLNRNCTSYMKVETEAGQYTSMWGDLKEAMKTYVVISERKSRCISTTGGRRLCIEGRMASESRLRLL